MEPARLSFSSTSSAKADTPAELETPVRRFKQAVIERALSGELTHHLGIRPAA